MIQRHAATYTAVLILPGEIRRRAMAGSAATHLDWCTFCVHSFDALDKSIVMKLDSLLENGPSVKAKQLLLQPVLTVPAATAPGTFCLRPT